MVAAIVETCGAAAVQIDDIGGILECQVRHGSAVAIAPLHVAADRLRGVYQRWDKFAADCAAL